MKTILLACCIILGVNSYEFDDKIYNQFLSMDFESLANDEEITILNHRALREIKDPTCRNYHLICCGSEGLESMHNDMREIRKECFKEVIGNETFNKPFDPYNSHDIEQRKKEMICIKQCVGKKKGCADEQGNLKEDVARKYMIEHTTTEWLEPKLDDIMIKCFAKARKAFENINKSDIYACNPAVIKFTHCVFRETQIGCPVEIIEDCEISCDRQFATHSTFFPDPPIA